MIYLDNAATTFPKPEAVYDSMMDCMKNYCANPGRAGHKLAMKAAREIYNTRENIIQLSILSKLLKKKQKIVEEINNFFPNLKVNKFNYRIHIRKNCNKSDGIKEINSKYCNRKNK